MLNRDLVIVSELSDEREVVRFKRQTPTGGGDVLAASDF